MSTLNTAGFVSRRRGGTFVLTDNESGTAYTVSGIVEDSPQITPGRYGVIVDTENGQPVRLRRGDAQTTRIRISFKQVQNDLNATSLYGLLLDQVKATDDGLLRTFAVTFKETDHSGDATGESEKYDNCTPVSVERRAGADHNTIEVEFVSLDANPTFATF
jgi:hypothetical protein